MKKKLLVSTMVAALILGSSTLSANESTSQESLSKSVKISVDKEKTKQKEGFKEAPQEIVKGFEDTLKAISYLEGENSVEAKKVLKSATENFQKALKASPELDIVPFSQEIVVNEFLGDSQKVKKALILANNLITQYDTQVAKVVLAPLQDEMIITTQAIPMKLYPLATEKALEALEKGDREKALEMLRVSLNTIITETVVMPLPLLVAEDLVATAAALDKSKKEEVLVLLNLAQDELKKALYLGYTKKHAPAYQSLDDQIEALKKEVKGKNVVEKLYDKLKNSFSSLVGQSREDSHSNQPAK